MASIKLTITDAMETEVTKEDSDVISIHVSDGFSGSQRNLTVFQQVDVDLLMSSNDALSLARKIISAVNKEELD